MVLYSFAQVAAEQLVTLKAEGTDVSGVKKTPGVLSKKEVTIQDPTQSFY